MAQLGGVMLADRPLRVGPATESGSARYGTPGLWFPLYARCSCAVHAFRTDGTLTVHAVVTCAGLQCTSVRQLASG